MSGYHTIQECQRIKERADKLGFMLCYPKHGWGSERGQDLVAIKPKDENSFPIYNRDAEFFAGTIRELNAFFNGLEWARDYDRMIGLSNNTKRERKEQDERNRQLVRILKDEKNNLMTK